MWQVSVFLLCLSLAAPPALANLAFESSGDLVFQVYKGNGDTSAQLITIIDNSGDARKAGLRAEGTSTWLQLPAAEMQLQHGRNQLQLAVDASELKPGRYHGAVVLTAMDGTANSVRKEVELRVFCGGLAPGSARLLEAPQVVVERLSRWEDGSDHAHVSVSLPWPQPQLLPEHLQVNAGKGRVLGVWEEEEEMCSKFKVHVSAPGAPAAADQAAQMQVELLPASAEAAAAIETTSLATRRLLQEEEGEGPICRLYAVDMGFCAPEGLITQESSTVLVVSCREVVVGICPPCFNVTGPPGVIVKYVGLFEGFDTFYEVSISWDSEYTGPVSVDINCPIFTLNGGDAVEIPPLNFTAGGLDMPALLVANSYRLEAADAAAGGTRRRIFSTKRN